MNAKKQFEHVNIKRPRSEVETAQGRQYTAALDPGQMAAPGVHLLCELALAHSPRPAQLADGLPETGQVENTSGCVFSWIMSGSPERSGIVKRPLAAPAPRGRRSELIEKAMRTGDNIPLGWVRRLQ
jgi:hypothetical protein